MAPHAIHTIADGFDFHRHSIVITGGPAYTAGLARLAKDADFMVIDSGGMIMQGGRRNQTSGRRVQGGMRAGRRPERDNGQGRRHPHPRVSANARKGHEPGPI